MSACANSLGFRHFLQRTVVVSSILLLAVGCATGESTFQDQQAELFSFGDQGAPWVGEVSRWKLPVDKSLQPPTSAEPIEVSSNGTFVFQVPSNWKSERLRARVQQPDNAKLTLLDIDGRLGAELWCLNHAADFVAPRARTLAAGTTENSETLASTELLDALGFVIVDDETLRFDQTCLSQGDTQATRAMLLVSYVLWELRVRDLDAFALERESFAQNGELTEDSVTFMRAAAEKAGTDSTGLSALARQRADAPETHNVKFPSYQRVLDLDGDGVPDFFRTCNPDSDPECRCVSDDPELCLCGNGILEQGERCESKVDGPTCGDNCIYISECGDGQVDGSEIYDEGAVCVGLDCHPELCALDKGACEGWVMQDFDEPAPEQAWRLQDGGEGRLVMRKDGHVGYADGDMQPLNSSGDSLVVRRDADTEGLLFLPSKNEDGRATVWLTTGETEEFLLETSAGSDHDEVQCAAVLEGSPANQVRVVVGWGGGLAEGIEFQEWHLTWSGGAVSAERVGETVSDYTACDWMAPHPVDGFVVSHNRGVSHWKGTDASTREEAWLIEKLDAPSVSRLGEDLLLWNDQSAVIASPDGETRPLELCLPVNARSAFGPALIDSHLPWARIVSDASQSLELGFVNAAKAPWHAPTTLYTVNRADYIFVGETLGVWVDHGETSTFYEYRP